MRGVHSAVDDIRRTVFKEVAKLALEGGDPRLLDQIPLKMIQGTATTSSWSGPLSRSGSGWPWA